MQRLKQFQYSGPNPVDGPELSDLERIFWNHDGRLVNKWHHYLPIYERYFSKYRGTNFKMLEIGVFRGGSLDMWRKYFGPEATIFGIDIDEKCRAYDGESGQVRIGSQDDPEFLASVVEEMGGVDVVLDDGSHDSVHIRASLEALFPRLNNGGVYMVEDLHCAYWGRWSGGYHSKTSFMNEVKSIVDDMHHWYHANGETVAATAGHVRGLHVYDSIVVLEKEQVNKPVFSRIGHKRP